MFNNYNIKSFKRNHFPINNNLNMLVCCLILCRKAIATELLFRLWLHFALILCGNTIWHRQSAKINTCMWRTLCLIYVYLFLRIEHQNVAIKRNWHPFVPIMDFIGGLVNDFLQIQFFLQM